MAAKIDFTTYPGNIINGEFLSTPTTRHSIDPATEQPLYEVPVATEEQLDLAVKHARTAFKTWSKTTHEERGKLLAAFADAIEEDRHGLEKLQTMEQGKPLGLARQEVDMALTWLRVFATMEVKDEILEDTEERRITSTFPPLGVCGAIVPWNWPILLGLGKVGPALMTGNAVIMKPSPFTPYCDLKLGEIGMSIFPRGVFQVLSGDDSLGPWMTSHPGIDMISFTGSIATGKKVAASCSKTLKRYVLELGGNDAAIVCEDVDIDKCLPKIATLSFLNSGQICMLTKRIYIHEKIYDEFRDAMVEFTKSNIKTGGGFEDGVIVGPVQNSMQYDLVKDMYAEIDKQGWKVALEGKVRESSKGYLIEPAIIDNPPEDSRIVVEEPFGPIVPLLKWSDEADVIDRANALETGLGASVWSRNLDRAEKMGRQLSAGSVWINSHFDAAPNVPFGGHKESGVGMEWGIEGFKHYTNSRSLWVWKKVDYGSSSDCENPPREEEPKLYSNSFIARVVIALLIGVFTSNADGSLVLATHPVIASEFGDLEDSSWLFISFMLAGAASQTVCTRSMWQVILGRVISGSGGAGMTTMASVIITEVASWQSYMNVIATVGRSLGGPLGGLLADTIGWRWSFLGQAPIFVISMAICGILLPSTSHGTQDGAILDRLARIDGPGALLLGGAVLAFMMPLEIGGQKIPWGHPLVFSLVAAGIVLAVAFVVVESRWAKEPIFPLRLLGNSNVTKSYLIVAAQSGAQLGMMYTVPIYFQVTQRVSSTVAGAHLFPAVIGNTVGGIASGLIIKRTGRYKGLIVFAAISSITSYTLMLARWHGQTNWLESLYVIPGGLGTGIAHSAAFIALQASIDKKDKAAGASGLFMTSTLGVIVGMAATSAIIQGILRHEVQLNLAHLGMSQPGIDEVIRKASESVSYINHATGPVQKILVQGYVKGIEYGHGLSILFSGVTLLTALLLKERAL
ncbi:hypothetical protein ACJ41O_015280 [Fusarium nematophilum]